MPGRVLEAKVQHDLWNNGVNGAVEDPALDGEGEVGQGKVEISSEEDMGYEAVRPALPLYCETAQSASRLPGLVWPLHTINCEDDQQYKPNGQRSGDMGV